MTPRRLSAIGLAAAIALSGALPAANAEPAQQHAPNPDSNAMLFGKPGEQARKVEAIPDANGLAFSLEHGDTLALDGETVSVVDDKGDTLLTVAPELPSDMTLWLDEETNEVFAVKSGITFRGCTDNKWVKWGIQGAWDGLVCLPATVAAAPGSPLAQGVTATACHTAGSGLVTAASC